MFNRIISKLKYIDLGLAVISLLLVLVGLTIIYSTSINGDTSIFVKQLLYALIGGALFFFFAFFDFNAVSKWGRYLYVLLFASLILVLKLGHSVNGSARWFDLKIFTFQPAEFMKLIAVLILARFFAVRRGEIKTWKNILFSFLYVFLPMLLIAAEPDLGSSIILFVIWFGVLLLSNVHKKVFIYIFVAFAIVAGLSWKFALKDYQKTRIEIFLDPNLDPRGRGYNVKQAVISVGSGGIFGRGLGKGLQSQLRFLPERQTDFVFASASEELGFVGSLVIVLLYLLLLWRLLAIYKLSRDDLGRFIIVGIFFMILGQAVINIGMNIGILPVTGIPLPLISAGGSSFLTVSASLGIAESVAIRSKGLHLQ